MEAVDSLSVVNKMMSPDAIKLDRFDGTNFTRWKDKLFFFLTELGVAYLLSGNLPAIPDESIADTDEIRASRKKREEDEVRCRGYILNALSDRLYDLFRSFKSPQEIWCALESKYTSEKQGTDRFLSMKFFEFQMFENKSVMDQVDELLVLVSRLKDLKVEVSEPLQVAAVIAKLPTTWNAYRKKLLHTSEDFTIDQLIKHIRIEEETRFREKRFALESGSKVNYVESSTKRGKFSGNKRKFSETTNDYSANYKKNKSCHFCGKKGHTQFWMSSLFSAKVVGTANGVAGGWGNLGGGATQLIMPLVFDLIGRLGATTFTAWRIAFFIPAFFQTLSAYGIFFLGQDLPDGNYAQLHKSGEKHKDNLAAVLRGAAANYRGWILALTYGYCFGVELTIDNIIAQYFYDRFDVNLHTAGMIAASFGLANLFSRPGGGMLSDFMAAKFGMRGRLWTLWVVQTVGGVFCILLGKVGSLGLSVAILLVFSIFVQAACGLTFGVVPFVSRRSLGIISGMTGGGGNVGAVLTQVIFFRGSRYSTETGITLMGVMIVCCTLVIPLIHFPQWGGMLRGPSSDGATEEDYYLSEWTAAEQEKGFHKASLKFSENSRSERGTRIGSAPDANPNTYV